ncbi:hypothetical protein H1P_1850003 [Hyella patelloides LEGE 07179]|uniref:Uncharacterized protein n=1 Tax=Hyella patelloides LEGE 07179 TaxID=945734 RepID=A0A563VPC7_9CYAN|nr:hypothetical protein [Hyella patelloides]VEP13137.1 hypothetical protein H1P_1850003 [Hyella patelloides LEGE 07179]
MDKITEIVCKADILFGLRPTLEKFGFSQNEDLVVAFEYKDKIVKTEPIAPVASNKSSTLNSQDLNAVVQDWLNKAEMQYELSLVIGDKLGLPKKGDFDITVSFTSKSNTFAVSSARLCWPCFIGAGFCCWK